MTLVPGLCGACPHASCVAVSIRPTPLRFQNYLRYPCTCRGSGDGGVTLQSSETNGRLTDGHNQEHRGLLSEIDVAGMTKRTRPRGRQIALRLHSGGLARCLRHADTRKNQLPYGIYLGLCRRWRTAKSPGMRRPRLHQQARAPRPRGGAGGGSRGTGVSGSIVVWIHDLSLRRLSQASCSEWGGTCAHR